MIHTPHVPMLTLNACAQELHQQDPENREIIIYAVTLDGPIVKVGKVQDLAVMIQDIREERIDSCDPYVAAPDPLMPSRLIPLEYEIEGTGGSYTVVLKWPAGGGTARGFYTLDQNA